MPTDPINILGAHALQVRLNFVQNGRCVRSRSRRELATPMLIEQVPVDGRRLACHGSRRLVPATASIARRVYWPGKETGGKLPGTPPMPIRSASLPVLPLAVGEYEVRLRHKNLRFGIGHGVVLRWILKQLGGKLGNLVPRHHADQRKMLPQIGLSLARIIGHVEHLHGKIGVRILGQQFLKLATGEAAPSRPNWPSLA